MPDNPIDRPTWQLPQMVTEATNSPLKSSTSRTELHGDPAKRIEHFLM
jgi:hypothetical protein